jgi:hypothetical protein
MGIFHLISERFISGFTVSLQSCAFSEETSAELDKKRTFTFYHNAVIHFVFEEGQL